MTKPVNEKGNKENSLSVNLTRQILSDEPITLPEQDKLNRDDFAKHIADSLLLYENKSCLIVSINGHWGIGKTSLLNLIEGYLKNPADIVQKPIVVRFNPWNISTTDQLIAMLFHEIRTALVRSDKVKNAEQIAKLLGILGAILTVGQLSPVGNQYFTLGADLAKKAKSKIVEMSKKSLNEIKEEINKLLSINNGRIIILIDDADRLDQDSMTLLFRVIRLNADFKNVTYILTFDRNIVIEMLEREQPGHGSDYLEKIVQLSIDMPEPEKTRVLKVLDEGLIEYLNEYSSTDKHWEKLVIDGRFRDYFNDIRQVKRFLNGLNINYHRVTEEVDITDFMGLEAIRIFAPRAYDGIRLNKEILTRLSTAGHFGQSENIDKTREILEQIFNPFPKKNKEGIELPESKRLAEVVKSTSRILFPQLSRIYSNTIYSQDHENIWRKNKRICSKEIFDKYFLLGVPVDELSDAEIQLIVEKSNNRLSFFEALDDLFNRKLGVRFLERVDDFVEKIPSKNIEQSIEAIFDVGDKIGIQPRMMLQVGADLQAASVIYRLLKQVPTKQRENILRNTIKTSKTVFLPVYFVATISHDKDALQEMSFSAEDMETFHSDCINLIKKAAKESTLSKLPNLGYVLYRWLEWGNEADVKDYVQNLVQTKEGLIDFLVGMSTEILSDYGERRRNIRREDIKKFIDISIIEPNVNALKEQDEWEMLDNIQKEVVNIFLNPKDDPF